MSFPAAQTLVDKSTEVFLNHFAPRPFRRNLAWSVARAEAREIRVFWPKQYGWEAGARWMETLVQSFSQHVAVQVVDDIPQTYPGTVGFRVQRGGRTEDIAIVYTDYLEFDLACADQCKVVFKMQYDWQGYGRENVVPGGYVPGTNRLYFYLTSRRKLRERQLFRHDVYGRFGREFGKSIREQALSLLEAQQCFAFEGGLKLVPYAVFLEEVARSKVCIDLPGTGDLCFRLVNTLAIGSCIVAYPQQTRLPVPLVPGKHIVYTRPDLSDLVSLCEHYVEHAAEREEIARNAREYFDLNLHKDNLILYYLRTILDRI